MKFDGDLYQRARRKIAVVCAVAMLLMALSYAVSVFVFTIRPIRPVEHVWQPGVGWQEQVLYQQPGQPQPLRKPGDQRQRAIKNLVVTSAVVLVAGVSLSYVLAREILRPIKQAHERQTAFTANAQHQMKTPIAAMRAELEHAQLGQKNKQAQAVYASLLEELETLEYTTASLLVHASSGECARSQTAFSDFKAHLQRVAGAHAIQLDTQGGVPVPMGEADLRHITEVVIGNVADHAQATHKCLAVRVTQTDQAVTLVFADNGGHTQVDASRIFERGYTTNAQAGNSGLGLALVHDIVTSYGGSVKAQATAQGFTLTIVLPC